MQLTQAVISGIEIEVIYALVAVGLTIIWGLMGMINFAHGELMMWGMFAAWSLSFFFKRGSPGSAAMESEGGFA